MDWQSSLARDALWSSRFRLLLLLLVRRLLLLLLLLLVEEDVMVAEGGGGREGEVRFAPEGSDEWLTLFSLAAPPSALGKLPLLLLLFEAAD